MKRILFGNVFLASALGTLAYFLVARIVPVPPLIVALTGASIGISILVTIVYAPLFWKSTRRLENRVSLLAIGMGFLFASLIGRNIVSGWFRAFGEVEKLPNHYIVGYLMLVGCVGMILHVVAPGYPPQGFRERFGGRYRWFILLSLVGGAAIALALTYAGFSV